MKTFLFFAASFFLCQSLFSQKVHHGKIRILYTPGHPANTFIPSKNIGGAIDGHLEGDIQRMLNSENIEEMKTTGLKPVSYRLRTELAGEVWHWNPVGTWSEKDKQQGYWISESAAKKPIEISNGYRLPRRGNTFDQANNDGYSRIDDGDSSTFWKSNPYLDSYFTKENNILHPQWVIVDLGKKHFINALRIRWGNPYPLTFSIDYAKDVDPGYFDPFQPCIWHSFSNDSFHYDQNKIIKVENKNIKTRFIRISMANSSHTYNLPSQDIRDRLGFAMKELQVGFMNSKGKFQDDISHSPDHKQSVIYVSSTDPWHTSKDMDSNIEQVGIDKFFTSGITANQPVLMPAGLLYDTPENVMSLIKYLKGKNYPVKEIEMGEEPEGQLISPVDYAALYLQLGNKIKRIDSFKLGGPGFAAISFTPDDSSTFTESKWTELFLNYLKKHDAMDLFNFFTFEWYPFDNLCANSNSQLLEAPKMLATALQNFKNILPKNIPRYLTEYGYSAYEGRHENEIQGALMYADILGQYLECGGKKNFLYGYEPAFLQQSYPCAGYGNNMLFGLSSNGKIKYRTAAYYGTRMITRDWAYPSDSVLEIYPAETDIESHKSQPVITTYPLRTDEGRWSIMLINKDPTKTWNVDIDLINTLSNQTINYSFQKMIQYSKQQYHWIDRGFQSYPSLNLPPVSGNINGTKNLSLPPYSITVIN